MATEVVAFRIPKKKVPTLKLARTPFRLPEANGFFSRVMRDKGVLASSQCMHREEQPEEVVASREQGVVVRSASLQISRKVSLVRTEHRLPAVLSVPKMGRREGEEPREIIKSELGCFNYFDILRRKEEASEKRLHGSHLTRLSSFISEEEALPDEPHAQSADEQLRYEEYDEMLMKPEPMVYRRRAFKLKHKADWSIAH